MFLTAYHSNGGGFLQKTMRMHVDEQEVADYLRSEHVDSKSLLHRRYMEIFEIFHDHAPLKVTQQWHDWMKREGFTR